MNEPEKPAIPCFDSSVCFVIARWLHDHMSDALTITGNDRWDNFRIHVVESSQSATTYPTLFIGEKYSACLRKPNFEGTFANPESKTEKVSGL
jgi:hypothetical protein